MKFLDVNLVTYFSKIMAISEVVSVVLSGPAIVLAFKKLLCRKKSTLNQFFIELLRNFTEYTDSSPQVGRSSSLSCVFVKGILLSPYKEQPTCTHAVLSFLAGKMHISRARKEGNKETEQSVLPNDKLGLSPQTTFDCSSNTSDCSPSCCFLRLMCVGAVLLKTWSMHHLQTFKQKFRLVIVVQSSKLICSSETKLHLHVIIASLFQMIVSNL